MIFRFIKRDLAKSCIILSTVVRHRGRELEVALDLGGALKVRKELEKDRCILFADDVFHFSGWLQSKGVLARRGVRLAELLGGRVAPKIGGLNRFVT